MELTVNAVAVNAIESTVVPVRVMAIALAPAPDRSVYVCKYQFPPDETIDQIFSSASPSDSTMLTVGEVDEMATGPVNVGPLSNANKLSAVPRFRASPSAVALPSPVILYPDIGMFAVMVVSPLAAMESVSAVAMSAMTALYFALSMVVLATAG
jgi:hypothetical protein